MYHTFEQAEQNLPPARAGLAADEPLATLKILRLGPSNKGVDRRVERAPAQHNIGRFGASRQQRLQQTNGAAAQRKCEKTRRRAASDESTCWLAGWLASVKRPLPARLALTKTNDPMRER